MSATQKSVPSLERVLETLEALGTALRNVVAGRAELADKRDIQQQEVRMWRNTIYQLESRFKIARRVAQRTDSEFTADQEASYVKQIGNAHAWLEAHLEELAALDTSDV